MKPSTGRVSLVGAGPGDPELLTLKAIRAIRTATVLLVDDDRALLGLLRDYLQTSGYRVSTAVSGREMRQVLADHRIDLIGHLVFGVSGEARHARKSQDAGGQERASERHRSFGLLAAARKGRAVTRRYLGTS